MTEALKEAYMKKIADILDKPIRDAKIQIDYHYDEVPLIRYDITEYLKEEVNADG